MGFRTVVVLHNDNFQDWVKDPELGQKIAQASSGILPRVNGHAAIRGNYGTCGAVFECVHADTQTLAVLDSYGYRALSHHSWHNNITPEETEYNLVKEAADKLGYRLVKKTVPKL